MLQDSKILLEKTLNNLNEVVIVADRNRQVLMANKTLEKIFGYIPEEIVGKSTQKLHVSLDNYNKLAIIGRPVLEKSGIFQTIYKMKKKDGSVIDCEITTTVIIEEDGWQSGIISVIRDISERIQVEAKIEEYQESLRQLTTQLSLSEEKQRKDIAVNIHDNLSQYLAAAQLKLKELKNEHNPETIMSELDKVSEYISEALENSRKITYDLSPPILYELGIVETLYWMAENTEKEHGIQVVFTSEVKELNLSESKLIIIYRILQELVNNAIKHSEAEKIEIEFKCPEDNLLGIIVRDNGKGFNTNVLSDTKFRKDGFGLFAVRERINNLGGDFRITSQPQKGTEIRIHITINIS